MDFDELMTYIRAIPYIPRWQMDAEYKSKCPCGGTLTAKRLKPKAHIFVRCDKCKFVLRE